MYRLGNILISINNKMFDLVKKVATLLTSSVTTISYTSATSGGNITDNGYTSITSRGVCWSTSANPTVSDSKTINGTGTGSFTSYLTGLTDNTSYYVRAYAINSTGTGYGNSQTFTTVEITAPSVTISTTTNITATGATGNATVTSDNGSTITSRGFAYGTGSTPTVSGAHIVVSGTVGVMSGTLTGLTAGLTYYVRAYAINSKGTTYSTADSFMPTAGKTYYWVGSNVHYTGDVGNNTNPITTPTITQNSPYDEVKYGYFGNIFLKQGKIYWIGYTNNYQSGIQNTTVTSFTQIGTDSNWKTVSCGGNVTFGIKTNGTLWAWGLNSNYGTGLGTNAGTTTSPTQVGTATNWAKVFGASNGGRAIKTDGTIWRWGRGQYGTLFSGSNNDITVPTQYGTDTDWIYAAGGLNTLLLKSNMTMWTCGYTPEIEDGISTTQRNTLSQLGSSYTWVKVSMSSTQGHAINNEGKLFGWGWNTYGGVGDNSTTDRALKQIGTDTDWKDVHDAGRAAFAIKTNGKIYGWGDANQNGFTTQKNVPTQIGTGTDWVSLASVGGDYPVGCYFSKE
jgi:hypothetical protein